MSRATCRVGSTDGVAYGDHFGLKAACAGAGPVGEGAVGFSHLGELVQHYPSTPAFALDRAVGVGVPFAGGKALEGLLCEEQEFFVIWLRVGAAYPRYRGGDT